MLILELAQILDSVDRKKTFEAAAHELCKVRSALTYTIKKYEQYFGFEIFDRSHYRVQFTAAGRLLLEQGRQMLAMNNEAICQARELASGWEREIKIAYDELLNIQPLFDLIKDFQVKCPKIDLYLCSERLNGCLDALLSGRVDLAIGLSGQMPTAKEFAFVEMGQVEFIFAVAPGHPLASSEAPLSQEQIYQYPAIVASDSATNLPLRTTGLVSTQKRITFTSMALKIQAQENALGVGFLPAHLIQTQLNSGSLIKKEVIQNKPTTSYYLVWSKEKAGKGLKWFISKLKEQQLHQKFFKP